MAFDVKTFTTRTITAAIFVAVLLSCILFHTLSFTILFLIISIWGLYEFYILTEWVGAKPYKWLGYLIALFVYISNLLSYHTLLSTSSLLAGIIVCVFLVFIRALFDTSEHSFKNISYTLTGVMYAVVPFVLLNKIADVNITSQINYNPHYVLGIILLIWTNDVCAYLVGSFFGKHKLFERISPKKTWEGTVGAAILTIGASFLIAQWFDELELVHWIVIAMLVSVFGTVGDLVESMFKRQAGVKDSGKIMPGHGGILDRFDSLLFVSPFIYLYLTLFT